MNFFGFVVIRLWGSYFYICVYLIQHSTFMHPREQSIHILEKCCSSLALRHIYIHIPSLFQILLQRYVVTSSILITH